MPGFFVSLGARCRRSGGTRLYATVRPNRYGLYNSCRTIMSHDWPMDDMVYLGEESMTADEMHAVVSSYAFWWYGRIYRNYGHCLDFYVKFASAPTCWFHYELHPPAQVWDSETHYTVDDYYAAYPQPADFYLSLDRNFVAVYTDTEFEAYETGAYLIGA